MTIRKYVDDIIRFYILKLYDWKFIVSYIAIM